MFACLDERNQCTAYFIFIVKGMEQPDFALAGLGCDFETLTTEISAAELKLKKH
jgi:hypothetical protein